MLFCFLGIFVSWLPLLHSLSFKGYNNNYINEKPGVMGNGRFCLLVIIKKWRSLGFFSKILITLVIYHLLGMKQHNNSFKWHRITCSLFVKNNNNNTTLQTENPIKHSVLFFKLVKNSVQFILYSYANTGKGIASVRMFICKGIIMTNMIVWVFGNFL